MFTFFLSLVQSGGHSSEGFSFFIDNLISMLISGFSIVEKRERTRPNHVLPVVRQGPG